MPLTKPNKPTADVDVSFELAAGETSGVVGEPGCGKSVRMGRDLLQMGKSELRGKRKGIQPIF